MIGTRKKDFPSRIGGASIGTRKLVGQTQRDVRINNLHAVLTLFRENDALSIRDITERTGLSKTAVSKILSQLMDQGLIESLGKDDSVSSRGKRPDLFCFSSPNRYVISCVLTSTLISAQLYGPSLKELYGQTRHIKKEALLSYQDAVSLLAHLILHLIDFTHLSYGDIIGIAISTVGVVSPDTGTIVSPLVNHHWGNHLPLAQNLAQLLPFSCDIIIDNIIRFSTYRILDQDAGKRQKNLVILYCDNSVGGTYVRNGHIVHGKHGYVGEFGHITTDYTFKEPCSCGKYGCFESIVASEKIQARISREIDNWPESILNRCKDKSAVPIHYLFQAADEGDTFSRLTVDLIAKQFAVMVYNFQILYDPDEILIYAYQVKSMGYFRRAFYEKLTPFLGDEHLEISLHPVGCGMAYLNDACAGAAAYCFNQYFDGRGLQKIEPMHNCS